MSPRSVSDLERGSTAPPAGDTTGLLADALGLAGPARELFVAAARGRVQAAEALAAGSSGVAGRQADVERLRGGGWFSLPGCPSPTAAAHPLPALIS